MIEQDFGVTLRSFRIFRNTRQMLFSTGAKRAGIGAQIISIGYKPVHHLIQIVKLLPYTFKTTFGYIQQNIWLSLSYNAANIFSALNKSVIFASQHIPRLPACDTADVIAYMLIADRSMIGAALHDAGGIAGNAACVTMSQNTFFFVFFGIGFIIFNDSPRVCVNIGNIIFLFFIYCIYSSMISAALNKTTVFSCNTARRVFPDYTAH